MNIFSYLLQSSLIHSLKVLLFFNITVLKAHYQRYLHWREIYRWEQITRWSTPNENNVHVGPLNTNVMRPPTGVKQRVDDTHKLRPHSDATSGASLTVLCIRPGGRRWLLLGIFFSQICPWAREAFQSKPTFLAPCSYAGPSEYASPWDGATVMEWFPGPADLVVGAWTPHCGGASAMDPNEHFYSRSQGIYTLHLTPNTLKSKEIVTGKRDQKTEKTKPKTNLQQPQNIKMYNKLNWKWRKQSNLWLKCKAGLQKLQATVNHPDTLKSVDYQLLTNSAHQWFYGNQLELYFNPSCKQSTIGLELLSKSLRPIFWPWLPVPSPYWFSMPCPLSLSLSLWSQVQMPPSTGKSPFLFVVLSIPSTHCGANSTLM